MVSRKGLNKWHHLPERLEEFGPEGEWLRDLTGP